MIWPGSGGSQAVSSAEDPDVSLDLEENAEEEELEDDTEESFPPSEVPFV